MDERVELAGSMVRIGSDSAVVAADTGNVRLAVAAEGGEMLLPTYAARHFASAILRACREADLQAAGLDEPRVPRRDGDLPRTTSPWG